MSEERFDIYDAEMKPLGTAARRDVHANGYWHKSFHCWLVRREKGRLLLLFQKRQAGKDTYPGCYDITVAGHLSAGETVKDAVREIEEEIGIPAAFEQLAEIGEFRAESAGEAGGIPFIDREISCVYGMAASVSLDGFRLQREEVAGLYEADLDEMLALFEGRSGQVEARGIEWRAGGGMRKAGRAVTADAFVPREGNYYAKVCRALREIYEGRP